MKFVSTLTALLFSVLMLVSTFATANTTPQEKHICTDIHDYTTCELQKPTSSPIFAKGKPGQVLGYDANGNLVPVDLPKNEGSVLPKGPWIDDGRFEVVAYRYAGKEFGGSFAVNFDGRISSFYLDSDLAASLKDYRIFMIGHSWQDAYRFIAPADGYGDNATTVEFVPNVNPTFDESRYSLYIRNKNRLAFNAEIRAPLDHYEADFVLVRIKQ